MNKVPYKKYYFILVFYLVVQCLFFINVESAYAAENNLIMLDNSYGEDVIMSSSGLINESDLTLDNLEKWTDSKVIRDYIYNGNGYVGDNYKDRYYHLQNIKDNSKTKKSTIIKYIDTRYVGEIKTLNASKKRDGYKWYRIIPRQGELFFKVVDNEAIQITEEEANNERESGNYKGIDSVSYYYCEVTDLDSDASSIKIDTKEHKNLGYNGFQLPYMYAKISGGKIIDIDKVYMLEGKSEIVLTPQKKEIYVKVGDNVSLKVDQISTKCKVDEYRWYKVENDKEVYLSTTATEEYVIKDIDENDFGTYKCIAYGENYNCDETTIEVYNSVNEYGIEEYRQQALYNTHFIETVVHGYQNGNYKITTTLNKLLPRGEYQYVWLRKKQNAGTMKVSYELPDISDTYKKNYINGNNATMNIINDTYRYVISDFMREGIVCCAIPVDVYNKNKSIKEAIENARKNGYDADSIEKLRKAEMTLATKEAIALQYGDGHYSNSSIEHPLGLENVMYMEQILPCKTYDFNNSNVLDVAFGESVSIKAMNSFMNRPEYQWYEPNKVNVYAASGMLNLRYMNLDDYGTYLINDFASCTHDLECKDSCRTGYDRNLYSNIISLNKITASGEVYKNNEQVQLKVNAKVTNAKLKYTWIKKSGNKEEVLGKSYNIVTASDTSNSTLTLQLSDVGYYTGDNDNSVTYICKVNDGFNRENIELKVRDDKSFIINEKGTNINSNAVYYYENNAGKNINIGVNAIKEDESCNEVNYTWYKDGKKISSNLSKIETTFPEEGLTTYRLVISSKTIGGAKTSSETRKVDIKYVLRTKLKDNTLITTMNLNPKVDNVKKCMLWARGTNAIKLYWGKVRDASGYRLYVQKNGKWQRVTETKSGNYTFTRLAAGNTHKFAVKAYRIFNGKVIWASSIATYTVATKPAQVKSFKLSARTCNSITVQWNRTTGANGYRMYVMQNGKWVYKGNTSSNTYIFKGLKRNTSYKVAIRPYKISGKEILLADKISVANVKTLK